MDLKQAKFLVTGGALGIGKVAAKLLAESGADVAITARNEERLKKAADEINAFPIPGDVSNPSDVDRIYDVFMKKFGRLDCLVNNAGIGGRRPRLEEASLDDFEAR